MKRIITTLFAVFLLITSHELKPMAHESAGASSAPFISVCGIQINPRGLLIFLDESEREFSGHGVITGTVCIAIMQEAGPILVSTSILNSIFQTHNTFEYLGPLRIWWKGLKQVLIDDHLCLGGYSLASAATLSFKDDTWVIKKVNDNMCLLIPQKSLPAEISLQDTAHSLPIESPLTLTELILGLKVNHLPTITRKDLTSTAIPIPTNKLSDAAFIHALSAIFCRNNDYIKAGFRQRPWWSIYLDGHGTTDYSITGLSIECFKHQCLPFFNHQIRTRALYYNSCYAAGTNHEKIYRDDKNGTIKTYFFDIVTTALTNAPVTAPIGFYMQKEADRIIFVDDNHHHKVYDYNTFLTEATCPATRTIDHERAIRAIVQKGYDPNATPQIKLRGLEDFDPIENTVIQIKQSLIEQHNLSKPLIISDTAECNPTIIAIYTPDIPCELRIMNTSALSGVVFMPSHENLCTIKNLSTDLSFEKIINILARANYLYARASLTGKNFFIEKCIAIDGEYSNFINSFSSGINTARYKRNGKEYETTILRSPDGFNLTTGEIESPNYNYYAAALTTACLRRTHYDHELLAFFRSTQAEEPYFSSGN